MPWSFWKAKKSSSSARATFTQLPARGSDGAERQAGTSSDDWQQMERLQIGSEQRPQQGDLLWPVGYSRSQPVSGTYSASSSPGAGYSSTLPSAAQRQAFSKRKQAEAHNVHSRSVELNEHVQLHQPAREQADHAPNRHAVPSEHLNHHAPPTRPASAASPLKVNGSHPLPASPLLSMPLQPLLEGTEGAESRSGSVGSSLGVACSTASEDSCVPPLMIRTVPTDGSAPAEILQLQRTVRSEGGSPRASLDFDCGLLSLSHRSLRRTSSNNSGNSLNDPQKENRGQSAVVQRPPMPVSRKLRCKPKPSLSSTIPARGPAARHAAQYAADVRTGDIPASKAIVSAMAPQSASEIAPAPSGMPDAVQRQQQQQHQIGRPLSRLRHKSVAGNRHSLESDVSTPSSTVSQPQPGISLNRLLVDETSEQGAGRQQRVGSGAEAHEPDMQPARAGPAGQAAPSQQLLTGLCFAADPGAERQGAVEGLLQGQFAAQALNGIGSFTSRDGTCYDGEWQCNLPDGYGVAVGPEKATFLGGFKSGMLHGVGMAQYCNGDCYAGESLHGVWHGHGLLQLADGSHYSGCFEQGHRSGLGTYTFSQGDCYWGTWHQGAMTGLGVYQHQQGQIHEGMWHDGYRHGWGVVTSVEGQMWASLWHEGTVRWQCQLHHGSPAELASQQAEALDVAQETARTARGTARQAAILQRSLQEPVGSWQRALQQAVSKAHAASAAARRATTRAAEAAADLPSGA